MAHFGDMKYSWNVSGYGTSGVVSAQFSFSVPSAEHSVNAFSGGDTVILTGSGGSWTFYVQSRSDDGSGKINFVCFDRAGFVDCPYPTDRQNSSQISGKKTDSTDSTEKEEDKIYLSEVLAKIASACGYASCLIDGDLLDLLPKVFPSALENKTCRNILEDIASALVGYWAMSEKVYLKFYPYGKSETDAAVSITEHTAVQGASAYQYSDLIMTGDERYVYSGSMITADRNALEINTAYASQELCEAVGARVCGYIYKGWICDTAVLPTLVSPPALVNTSGSGSLRANHCTAQLSSAGIFADIGANVPDEAWQYKGKVYRELDSRLKTNMNYGNVKVTSKGLKLVYINENKG